MSAKYLPKCLQNICKKSLTKQEAYSIILKVVRNNIRKAGIRLTLAHTVTSGSYKVENDPEMEFPIVYERVV